MSIEEHFKTKYHYKSWTDSLNGLLSHDLLKYACKVLGINENLISTDITEQALFTSITAGFKDDTVIKINSLNILNTHWSIFLEVTISHLIDDYFDIYDNHIHSRNKVIEILFDETLDNTNKFKTILDCILGEGFEGLKKAISRNHSNLKQVQKEICCKNYLQMIIAGLIQTENKASASSNLQTKMNNQSQLINLYKTLAIGDCNGLVKNLYSGANYELVVSTASSLQGMFLCHEGITDLSNLRAWDCILGPLIFLNNFKTEKTNQDIYFFESDEQFLFTDFSSFVANAYNILVDDYKEEKNLFKKIKFMQFCLAIDFMNRKTKANSFKNYPIEYINLIQTFMMIYRSTFEQGILKKEELRILEEIL